MAPHTFPFRQLSTLDLESRVHCSLTGHDHVSAGRAAIGVGHRHNIAPDSQSRCWVGGLAIAPEEGIWGSAACYCASCFAVVHTIARHCRHDRHHKGIRDRDRLAASTHVATSISDGVSADEGIRSTRRGHDRERSSIQATVVACAATSSLELSVGRIRSRNSRITRQHNRRWARDHRSRIVADRDGLR